MKGVQCENHVPKFQSHFHEAVNCYSSLVTANELYLANRLCRGCA